MSAHQQQPFMNARDEEGFRFLGIPSQIRASAETTNGSFGLVEHWDMPTGFESPYHTHHREDESFYVLEGEVAFVCGGQWLKAGPGAFVHGPLGIPHGFKVISEAPARMLLLCAPSGFEGFVRAGATSLDEPPAPPDMVRLLALAAEYEIDILGPLPEGPPED